MKSIYLIDGGFFTRKFQELNKKFPVSKDVEIFIERFNKNFNNDFEYLRIYYYDCPPSDKKMINPISNNVLDLKKSARYRDSMKLMSGLKRSNYVSVREGFLSVDGWTLKKSTLQNLKNSKTIKERDLSPSIGQKGVDIKIGLDIAWISLSKIAERIILITGDSDFIPAMKFARRNGIQVILSTLDHGVREELKDHTDKLVDVDLNSILNS